MASTFLNAFFGQGMRGEKTRQSVAVSGQVAQLLERTEKADHFGGIVSAAPGVIDAQGVGFPLIVAAVFQKQELNADPGDARDLGEGFAQGASDGQSGLDEDHLAQFPHAVAGVDVAQFVADDRGHFGLRDHHGQSAPRVM
jgi:hypothetical protein